MATRSPFPRTPSTASATSTWSSQSRNPVSARLYKVLSTNFDDEETRQALQTLSDLYATPKGKEVRVIPEDADDEFVQNNNADSTAVVLVEDIPGESASRARKNLRRDMEKQVAEGTLAVLSETRQITLLSSFITALTRGGPSGYPRPIELHAHDPLRYVGDMLAWVHQAIAAEREFMEGLFGMKNDGRMVGSVRRFDSKVEEEEWIRELMDLAVAKLCVPLKMRVQQTIRSQESSIVAYKIANLLQFYSI
ncbi:COG6-domain-containing protein [Agrocybe pediades]|nr:COG6-domain-containing protein [Agrocybe pediades]